MKKQLMIPALMVALAFGGSTSCNRPSEEKVKDAQQDIQDERKDVNKAIDKANAEWQDFKTDAEKKIQDNNVKIDKLKEKMAGADAKERANKQEKIDKLEAKNNELRSKIENFKYTSESDWQQFKREFNHDMDEMGHAFEDLGKDNVK